MSGSSRAQTVAHFEDAIDNYRAHFLFLALVIFLLTLVGLLIVYRLALVNFTDTEGLILLGITAAITLALSLHARKIYLWRQKLIRSLIAYSLNPRGEVYVDMSPDPSIITKR